MGTDNLGRNMFDQVIHGAATSMTVVASVLAMSAIIGVIVGAISGYRGGWLDTGLMRIADVLQAVPRLLLAILAVALLGSGLRNLIILLGLTSWTVLARVVRAETLSLKRREFVDAARSAGASDARILVRHILPNLTPSTVVVVSLLASRIVLVETSLAFVGLGDPDRVSLGFLLSEAQPYLVSAWWMSVFPGLFIVMIVLGFNLLGDALNDVLNPVIAKPVSRGRGRVRRSGRDETLPFPEPAQS